jgi:lipopolysaccharide transport protein LptA
MLGFLALAAALSAPAEPPARPAPVPVTVRFDEAEYRPRDRQTVMTGKPRVTLTRGDVTLACRRLVADNDEKGKIRKAVCEGDVELTRGTLVVTCATAVYEDAGARVTCKGEPTIREGQSVTTGEELTYELDADRITLTRGKGTLVPEPGQELPIPGGARR